MSTMPILPDNLPVEHLSNTTPASKDSTFVLSLSAEKMLKRFAQVGSAMFYVIVMDGEPVMLFTGGKIEVLKKLA